MFLIFIIDPIFAKTLPENDTLSVNIEIRKGASDNNHKKVGLVLSGGGSKGVAHIGVIQALEENGIPIDYIAGTSAGAIIGGLYAAGYTTQEMYDFFISQDLDHCLRGKIDDKYLYYFTKSDPDPTWLKARFKVSKEGIRFIMPTSIVSPKLLDFLFMEFFASSTALCESDFDSLFIPFRCVAADLTNQKPYYFKGGDLGLAIRASMTFPFYFNPIVLDSIVFFDGGIYDNFPVEKMKKDFDPDIIIGSKVANNFPPPVEGDPISYLQKMIAHETDYSLGDSTNSLMIEPDVPIVSVMNIIDFSNTPEITKIGYEATMKQMDILKKLVGNSVSKEEVEERRKKFNERKPPLLIDSVIVKNVSKDQAHYIEDLLQEKDNPNYSLKDLKEYYFRFFSDEDIKYIHPLLHYNKETQKYNMSIDLKMNRSFTTRIGGNMALGAPSQAFMEFDYWQIIKNMRMSASVNAYLGRFYNSFSGSVRSDFSTKLPVYLKLDAVYNDWDYFRTEMFYFNKYGVSYMMQREQFINLEAGIPAGRFSKLNMQATYSSERDLYYHKVPEADDVADRTTFKPVTFTTIYEKNNLDYVQYPSRGAYASFLVSYINGTEVYKHGSTAEIKNDQRKYHKYIQAKIRYNKYLDLARFYKLGFSVDGFYSTQKFFSDYTSTLLHAGVFAPTVEGTQRFFPEFRGTEYFALGLQNVFKITSNIQIRLEGYLFQPLRPIRQNTTDYTAFYGDYFERSYYIFSSGIVYHSPIGPVSLIFNYRKLDDTSYNSPFSVIFNIGYVLFNQRGVKR